MHHSAAAFDAYYGEHWHVRLLSTISHQQLLGGLYVQACEVLRGGVPWILMIGEVVNHVGRIQLDHYVAVEEFPVRLVVEIHLPLNMHPTH